MESRDPDSWMCHCTNSLEKGKGEVARSLQHSLSVKREEQSYFEHSWENRTQQTNQWSRHMGVLLWENLLGIWEILQFYFGYKVYEMNTNHVLFPFVDMAIHCLGFEGSYFTF